MIQFITDNWGNIGGVIAAALVVAEKIAKMSNKPAEEEFVAKVEAAVTALGILPAAK